MGKNDSKNHNSVNINVELTGEYDEVVDIISQDKNTHGEMNQIVSDFATIVETIEQLDGGTRSRIAESLPESFSLDLTGEELVGILRVLEYYDLVHLDQNTWKPASEESHIDESE